MVIAISFPPAPEVPVTLYIGAPVHVFAFARFIASVPDDDIGPPLKVLLVVILVTVPDAGAGDIFPNATKAWPLVFRSHCV